MILFRFLKEASSKKQPNMAFVSELMTLTFPQRHMDIATNAFKVKKIFDKYPFLKTKMRFVRKLH